MMTNDDDFISVYSFEKINQHEESYFTRMGHQIFLITFCFDRVNTHIRPRAVLHTLVMANLAENLSSDPRVNLSHRQLSGAVEACRTSLMELHSI